jgi:hypothetical protein
VPSILQEESRKRLLQGAAVGAVATIWSLGSIADKMATEQSKLAVVTALAPVCADNFRAQPDITSFRAKNMSISALRRSASRLPLG